MEDIVMAASITNSRRTNVLMRCMLMLITSIIFCSYSFAQINPNPPKNTVRLVFIHHSTGEGWLHQDAGGLITELNKNNYYVRDTNYDWGPFDEDVNDGSNVGSHTDIGHWYVWFLGPHRNTYLNALYPNNFLTDGIENSASISDPGGENTIVMFKSCFTSAEIIYGNPTDPPLPKTQPNPIYGQAISSADTAYTVANIKGLYRDLLDYFATKQNKLFVLITTPPSYQGSADEAMPKLRAINRWLIEHWLDNYSNKNVFVFDYYNVLTSNGGNPTTNDIGATSGSHHRYRNGIIEYQIGSSDFLAYASWDDASQTWDSHPTAEGQQKAANEFVPLLNIAYNRWKGTSDVGELRSSPETIILEQNYPNPFTQQTSIQLPLLLGEGRGEVVFKIYDIFGREVLDLSRSVIGNSSLLIRNSQLPAPGIYFYRLTVNGISKTKSLTLLR